MTVKKTALGIQVMKDRSVSLTPQQRSALILVDGNRSAEEVVRMTTAVGVTANDMQALVTMGLVELTVEPKAAASQGGAMARGAEAASAVPSSSSNSEVAPQNAGVDFQVALNAAITFCSDMGFKGFGLNMALTGVDTLEKLQKFAPEIRKTAGDKKYALLHPYIFGKPL